MKPENHPKAPLPLDEVIRIARSVTLKEGYHVPTVIADGSRQTIVTQVDPFAPTHEARAQQLFLLGAILSEHQELGVLQQIFLITEAWLSVATPENPPHQLPSQDPHRKEILSIARLALLPPQTDLILFEMERNPAGKLIRLKELNRQIGSHPENRVKSPLLEAFAIGFLGSTFKPDA